MAPVNDLFANAIVITGDSGVVRGNTVGASFETGEPRTSALEVAAAPSVGTNVGRTIWYEWTPSTSGNAWIRASAALPDGTPTSALVTLFTGTSVGALTMVAEDPAVVGQPRYVWNYRVPVTSGTTYRIQAQMRDQQGSSPFHPLDGDIAISWTLTAPPGPAFIASTTGSAAADNLTIATPSGLAVGDTLLGFLANNNAGTPTTPGWTVRSYNTLWGSSAGGIGSGSMWTFLLVRTADAADVAGTSYTWTVAAAVNVAGAILAYRPAAYIPAPGLRSTTAYRTSFSVMGSTAAQAGQIIPAVDNTLEVFSNATAGGAGGALSLASGTERARVDGALPLLVSEAAGNWTWPDAAQIFDGRILLAPDWPAPSVLPDVGGWGVGMIRMGANA